MATHEIRAVKDPATSGYAHAFVVMRPWTVFVGDRKLVDRRRRARRFATEVAALAAAKRAVASL